MKLLAVAIALAPLVCLADVGFKQDGTSIGPVRDLNCAADGGLTCTRPAASTRGDLRCRAAAATEPGCIVPGTQTLPLGNKTFPGNVKATQLDAGAAYIGQCAIVGQVANCPIFDGGLVISGDVQAGQVETSSDVTVARDVIVSRDVYGLTFQGYSGSDPTYVWNSQIVGGPTTAVRMGFFNPGSPSINDRLVDFGYNASSWTSLAWMGGAGVLKSATPFTLLSAYPNAALVASTTYGRTRVPTGGNQNFTVTAIDVDVKTAGSGGTTTATIRVSNGTANCDLTFACNAAAALRSNSGTSPNATLSGTCAFSSDDTLTLSANSIGDCSTGPLPRNISVIGNWQ